MNHYNHTLSLFLMEEDSMVNESSLNLPFIMCLFIYTLSLCIYVFLHII